jgi:hypothetical protein
MIPCQRAQQWWTKHNPQDFREVLTAHLLGGYVISTPEHFLMAHDMHWDGKEARTDMEPNGYFVTMASSSGSNALAAFMRMAPTKRDYVAWVRRGGSDIKVYSWDKLTRKVGI